MPPAPPTQLVNAAAEKRHGREDGISVSDSSKAICGEGELLRGPL